MLLLTVGLWGQPAELVLRGGDVYCLDEARSWARAVAVAQGKIVYVGDEIGVERWLGPTTRVVDLDGRMVLPGFCDSHVHPLLAGLEASRCQLNGVNSLDALGQKVKSYATSHPDLAWIVGSGWALTLFPQADPRRQHLDALVRDRPAALESADGHSMWLNTRALQVCGIDASTPDPPGGRIEREPGGYPSGTLREKAIALVQPHLPPTTKEQRRDALLWGVQHLNRLGITSFHEANAGPEDLAAYSELDQQGLLTARVVAAQSLAPVDRLKALRDRYRSPRLRPTAVKIFLDGVVEARTAALLQPYEGHETRGELLLSPEDLQQRVGELVQAGFQVHVHAIGDRAVRQALDSFEACPGRDLRHTIAHLQLIDPADVPRFARLGVVANVQAYWAQADEYITAFANPLLGPERAGRQYPLASLLKSGAVLAGGSDWSVSTANPLEAIEVALTRRAPGTRLPGWLPEQRLSLHDALAAYTRNGAFLSHLERETGSVEVGKWADLVVLERNLFSVEPEQIHRVRVVQTYLQGQPLLAEVGP